MRDWSGTLICYEGTVEDVTEKFEAERALRAALRQAELANRAKAAFLAAMSHELKTPLNAVLGFSEIIRDEMLGPVGQPAYRDYAADIHASGKRLLAIINDVLDVSRLEGGLLTIEARRPASGRSPNRRSPWRAPPPVKAGSSRWIFRARHAGLQVDPRRLAQALGNLLSNAIKFTTPEGGICAVSRGCRADGGMSFAVSTPASAWRQETIAAALEPFRQLDGTLAAQIRRRRPGPIPRAGAGANCTAAPHHRERGGQGTTVTVSLPAQCSERQALIA